MASFDGYETTRPMPEERRPGAPTGVQGRPNALYSDATRSYTFDDGLVVTDEELRARDEPLIRVYYEKKAAIARAAAEALEMDIALASRGAGNFTKERRAELERVYLQRVAVERFYGVDRGVQFAPQREYVRATFEGRTGLWCLAQFGKVTRDVAKQGLGLLGTFGEVMRLAADFNYGGATRGWMLEMD